MVLIKFFGVGSFSFPLKSLRKIVLFPTGHPTANINSSARWLKNSFHKNFGYRVFISQYTTFSRRSENRGKGKISSTLVYILRPSVVTPHTTDLQLVAHDVTINIDSMFWGFSQELESVKLTILVI